MMTMLHDCCSPLSSKASSVPVHLGWTRIFVVRHGFGMMLLLMMILVLFNNNVAEACSFIADDSVFVLEDPDVIQAPATPGEVATTALCDARNKCRNGVIRGCQEIICSGEFACYGTQILDIPDGGSVTCSGSNFACWEAIIQADETLPSIPSISVECSGNCDDAIIRGAKAVNCSGKCGSAQILDIPDGGVVSCTGVVSCISATVQPAMGTASAPLSSIMVNCIGSSSCDGAILTVGPSGTVDCRGGCGSAILRTADTVLCETDFACRGAQMENLTHGGRVLCSGDGACFGAGIKPAEEASILIECSGKDSCSVANLDSGGSSGKVLCSGAEACQGNILYADYTSIRSTCLDCETGSCLYPCEYASPGEPWQDCVDGEENGKGCSVDSPVPPATPATPIPTIDGEQMIDNEDPTPSATPSDRSSPSMPSQMERSSSTPNQTWYFMNLLGTLIGIQVAI